MSQQNHKLCVPSTIIICSVIIEIASSFITMATLMIVVHAVGYNEGHDYEHDGDGHDDGEDGADDDVINNDVDDHDHDANVGASRNIINLSTPRTMTKMMQMFKLVDRSY